MKPHAIPSCSSQNMNPCFAQRIHMAYTTHPWSPRRHLGITKSVLVSQCSPRPAVLSLNNGPKFKSSDTANLDKPKGNRRGLPLSEKVKILNKERKKKKSYLEIAQIFNTVR